MTTITLEVSDDLAGRLAPLQDQLPQLLAFALDLLGVVDANRATTAPSSPLITEIVDFLAQGPSHAEVVAFKVSPQAQSRLEELLDKNREGELTPLEKGELDSYQQVNHLLTLLKARARAALSSVN